MDDFSTIVDQLTRSYTRQLARYKELQLIVQKIVGRIALTRGDISQVMELFTQKQKLLASIEQDRESIKTHGEIWQHQKESIRRTTDTGQLEAILAEVESAIKAFLETEDQVKTCLEHVMAEKRNPTRP